MREELLRVEQALSRWVPDEAPARLGEAMRYGVLDGGKRLRPLLVLASRHAVFSFLAGFWRRGYSARFRQLEVQVLSLFGLPGLLLLPLLFPLARRSLVR